MWLAESALQPPLPLGWMRSSVAGAHGGLISGEGGNAEYYWNAASGHTQWEHPHVSFLTGVAKKLIQTRAEEARRARGFGAQSS